MSGYFGVIFKVFLIVMIFVIEMVGDICNFMLFGLVILVVYIIMDLFKGVLVYEVMLEKMLFEEVLDEGEVIFIEIFVLDKIVGK